MNNLFKIASTEEETSSSGGGILNLNFFTNKESTSGIGTTTVPVEEVSTGKKRGRPKKKTADDVDNMMVPADEHTSGNLAMHQSNEPYLDSYTESQNILRSSIYEIDSLNGTIRNEIETIKNSKTLKKKYDYLAQLASTSSTLIGTKVTAVREVNKTITDCHNLELKRIKDLKLNTNDEVDDNKYIMDMYNAFINTPVGNYNALNTPSITDMTMMSGVPGVNRTPIQTASANTYEDYVNNMNPIQNMMRLEQDPNVKTVVMYDASTGNRWFDVVNVTTGESIPNVDKPDAMFLEDTTLDTRNGIARNTNLDTTYPLIVLNGNVMMEY